MAQTFRQSGAPRQGERTRRPATARVAPGQTARRPGTGEPARRSELSPEAQRRRAAARREAELRAREEREREKSVRRFRRRRLFTLSFILSLIIVAGYWIVLSMVLHQVKAPKDAYPLQVFRAGEKEADRTFTVEESLIGGTPYLPLTVLQDYVKVTQYGDHAARSIGLPGGDFATFDLGTSECVVNGVHVSLEAPVYLEDDVLYLPVDFFYRRMNCFDFTFSSALNANVLTFRKDVTPAMRAHEMTPTDRIAPESAPASA